MAKARENPLRSRWTDANVARLRDVLPIDQDTWPKRPFALPRDRFATANRDGGGSLLDLRGFPLAVLACLHDRDIDFSFAKSPKNEHDVDLGIRLSECDLKHCIFDDAQTIQHIDFETRCVECSFRRARMREANLVGRFEQCVFDEANLRGAKWVHARFVECSFRDADLLKSDFGPATFERCDFRGARFGGGGIMGTRFLGCNLRGVDLADAFRDEDTLFDEACDLTGLRFAMIRRFAGEEMDLGPPPPVKRRA